MQTVADPPAAQAPAMAPYPTKRLRQFARKLLAGLNRILELGDFSRGDFYRN